MKFFYFSIFLFFLVSSLAAQDDLRRGGTISSPTIKVGTLSFEKEDDGIWRLRYPNGQVLSEGKFRWRFSLLSFSFYRACHGAWNYYSEDGILDRTIHYKRDRVVKYVDYKEGKKVKVFEYNKHGKTTMIIEYENGKIINIINYE